MSIAEQGDRTPQAESPGDVRRRRGTILIVEDDPIASRAMQILMNRSELSAVLCGTGTEAIDYAKGPEGPNIAAAVVDIHLPDVNGLVVSQQLRNTLGMSRPIVVLSGDNSIQTLRALPDAGASYFFAKPVRADELIERLRGWIAEPSTPAHDGSSDGVFAPLS